MGAAHDLAELKTGIVGNFPPTFARSESRHDAPEAVTGGFGQQVGLLQSAETEPRLRLLPPESMDRNSSLIRDLLQHTMVSRRRSAVLSVILPIMSPLVAVAGLVAIASAIAGSVIAGLFAIASVIAIPLIAGFPTVTPVIAIPVITSLLVTAILRSIVGSMGFAFDLPEVKTGIVRNFSPTFTTFESRDHLSETVARGFGQ
jgi:hypothetical protein